MEGYIKYTMETKYLEKYADNAQTNLITYLIINITF